jgi:hypothetical protein
MLTFNLNLYHRTLDKSFKDHFPNPRHTRGRRLRPEDKFADVLPRWFFSLGLLQQKVRRQSANSSCVYFYCMNYRTYPRFVSGLSRVCPEDLYLLGYNAVQPVISQQTFRKSMSTLPSESKNKPQQALLATFLTLISCLSYSSSLKMEAKFSSEISVDIQRTTWRYISEDTKPILGPHSTRPDSKTAGAHYLSLISMECKGHECVKGNFHCPSLRDG